MTHEFEKNKKMSANRQVVQFLSTNTASCERWACTTCGGSLHFLWKLEQTFPNKDELVEGLKSLKRSDVALIRNHRGISQVLNSLPEELRKMVFDSWMQNVQNDPTVAFSILLWTQYGKDLSKGMVHELLVAAESLIINSRKIRDELRNSLPIGIELPPRLKFAIEKDIRKDDKIIGDGFI